MCPAENCGGRASSTGPVLLCRSKVSSNGSLGNCRKQWPQAPCVRLSATRETKNPLADEAASWPLSTLCKHGLPPQVPSCSINTQNAERDKKAKN